MRWTEKWLPPFRMGTTSSITMQSLGIELPAPVVGAKIWCYCLSHLVCLRVLQFEQVLCRDLWIDFDAVFTIFQK